MIPRADRAEIQRGESCKLIPGPHPNTPHSPAKRGIFMSTGNWFSSTQQLLKTGMSSQTKSTRRTSVARRGVTQIFDDTACEMLYPMYVLPCKTLLNMRVDTMLSHQELLAKGKLVDFTKQKGLVAVISHQWLGFDHPDPAFAQMAVLQEFMRNILTGKVSSVDPDWVSEIYFEDKDRVGSEML